MAIFGIDASLSSTAVCRVDDHTVEMMVFTTSKPGKWHKALEPWCTTHEITHNGGDNYSDSEVAKLVSYREAATKIVRAMGISMGDVVKIEGYAARAKGAVADLITYGTFIRESVLAVGGALSIIAPMSLKSEAGVLVYGRQDGPKKPARNNEGMASGKFTKHEMLRAVKDGHTGNTKQGVSFDDWFSDACTKLSDDVLGKLKAVPSPLNDCVDAYLLCKIR